MNLLYRFPRYAGGLILLVLSVVPLGLAYYLAQPGLHLRLNGIRAEGTITGMVLVNEQHSAGYAPTVTFKDASGQSHRIERPFITDSPIGRVGDAVGVYYLPENPADARVDHWFHLWQWAFVPAAAGVVLFLAAITEFCRRRSL